MSMDEHDWYLTPSAREVPEAAVDKAIAVWNQLRALDESDRLAATLLAMVDAWEGVRGE